MRVTYARESTFKQNSFINSLIRRCKFVDLAVRIAQRVSSLFRERKMECSEPINFRLIAPKMSHKYCALLLTSAAAANASSPEAHPTVAGKVRKVAGRARERACARTHTLTHAITSCRKRTEGRSVGRGRGPGRVAPVYRRESYVRLGHVNARSRRKRSIYVSVSLSPVVRTARDRLRATREDVARARITDVSTTTTAAAKRDERTSSAAKCIQLRPTTTRTTMRSYARMQVDRHSSRG